MKPWVLVDISYMAHRARYALGELSYQDAPTGVLFGFFEQLRTTCLDTRVRSSRVVFLFDSKQSFRKQTFPAYKAHRKDDMSEEDVEKLKIMYHQVHLLRQDILPAIGFQVHRQTGCESDDLMAMAADSLQGDRREAILITADGDLWQCISQAVHWFDPARKVYYDPETFLTKKGINPGQWASVKALAGCNGDGVPGIPGVGEKTAIQHLLGTLPKHFKRAQALYSEEGKAIINRNLPLVKLPHHKTKPFELRDPELKPDVFFGMAERYGLMSYLREPLLGQWREFFSLAIGPETRKRGSLI